LGAEAAVTAGPPRTVLLWIGMLGGPTVWAADLLIRYALVHWSCDTRQTSILNLVSLVALILVASAGGTAIWTLRTLPSVPTDGGRPIARSRFMALCGVMSSLLFGLTVAAGAFPQWVLDACH
jgi:hypothetical protein